MGAIATISYGQLPVVIGGSFKALYSSTNQWEKWDIYSQSSFQKSCKTTPRTRIVVVAVVIDSGCWEMNHLDILTYMEVSINGEVPPKWMVYNGKSDETG